MIVQKLAIEMGVRTKLPHSLELVDKLILIDKQNNNYMFVVINHMAHIIDSPLGFAVVATLPYICFSLFVYLSWRTQL